jgi:hypothetical protein
MNRRVACLTATVTVLTVITPAAMAWGPHSEITVAAAKTLDKDDPFLTGVCNDMGHLGFIGWANDNAAAGAIVGYNGYRYYARDYFCYPGWIVPAGSDTGHGYDPKDDSYKMFFNRILQAMQTESRENVIGWTGAMVHLVEDTGAPPHAGHVPWRVHCRMEDWVDLKKLDLAGYKPQLLGETEEEALAGLYKRVGALGEFSAERGKKLIPVIDANDRVKAEPVITECAVESARVTADVLHTLGYLRAHLKPVEGSGGLSGTIKPGKNFELVMPKIMLLETPYSTLAGPDRHYEFRNLPARKYKAAVMLPTYAPKFFEVTVEAGKTATQDAELESNGNLLRNGGQTVRFLSKDQPDGWFVCLDPKPGAPTHFTELFTAMKGQAFRLTIKWKKDIDAEAAVLYHWKGWDQKKTLKAGTESMVFEAPQEMDGKDFAMVFIRCKGNPWDAIDSVRVEPEGKPAKP